MQLAELLKTRKETIDRADKILNSVQETKRPIVAWEQAELDSCTAELGRLDAQIKIKQSQNTIQSQFNNGMLIPAGPATEGRPFAKPQAKVFSEDYAVQFFDYIASNGARIGASLQEGSNSAGGYAVPIVVDSQIVPLAPREMAVRRIARVIPTSSDIKIPVKASFGATTAKAETQSFGNSEMTLSQVTLSAFMAGNSEDISWELAQDVPTFQATALEDLILGQQMYEEDKYINGSGSGEPQGLVANVDVGVSAGEPDSNGNLVTVNGTLDLVGSLNAVYHQNAAFLMQRETSIVLRKAQAQSNLFSPIWTRVGTQDYLHGYPVYFANAMPSCARGNKPVVFGDFSQGYLIGDRGGSGINIKVLDQPKALQGILTLLAYRRTDGRVRRSEALKSYRIALS
jgi:HK97 family phage major capsid protein